MNSSDFYSALENLPGTYQFAAPLSILLLLWLIDKLEVFMVLISAKLFGPDVPWD